MCVMPTSPRRQFRLVPSRPFPASSRPVRGKFSCNDDLCRTPWKRVRVVLRGLDPPSTPLYRPPQGVDAHGSSPWAEGPRVEPGQDEIGRRIPSLGPRQIFPLTALPPGGRGKGEGGLLLTDATRSK